MSLFLLGTLGTKNESNNSIFLIVSIPLRHIRHLVIDSSNEESDESLFLLGTLGTDDFFGKLPLFLQKAIFLSAQ